MPRAPKSNVGGGGVPSSFLHIPAWNRVSNGGTPKVFASLIHREEAKAAAKDTTSSAASVSSSARSLKSASDNTTASALAAARGNASQVTRSGRVIKLKHNSSPRRVIRSGRVVKQKNTPTPQKASPKKTLPKTPQAVVHGAVAKNVTSAQLNGYVAGNVFAPNGNIPKVKKGKGKAKDISVPIDLTPVTNFGPKANGDQGDGWASNTMRAATPPPDLDSRKNNGVSLPRGTNKADSTKTHLKATNKTYWRADQAVISEPRQEMSARVGKKSFVSTTAVSSLAPRKKPLKLPADPVTNLFALPSNVKQRYEID